MIGRLRGYDWVDLMDMVGIVIGYKSPEYEFCKIQFAHWLLKTSDGKEAPHKVSTSKSVFLCAEC